MISFPYRIPLPHRATLFPYTTLFRSDAGTDVRATDIDRKHRVVSFQYPRWKKVSCSNQSCLVWMIVKKLDGEICLVFLEQDARSEEHTSELQSHVNLVCRLLLEKKKQ